jgi:hypothetical protein
VRSVDRLVFVDVRDAIVFCVDVSWDWRCVISALRVAAVGCISTFPSSSSKVKE